MLSVLDETVDDDEIVDEVELMVVVDTSSHRPGGHSFPGGSTQSG